MGWERNKLIYKKNAKFFNFEFQFVSELWYNSHKKKKKKKKKNVIEKEYNTLEFYHCLFLKSGTAVISLNILNKNPMKNKYTFYTQVKTECKMQTNIQVMIGFRIHWLYTLSDLFFSEGQCCKLF